EPWSIPLLASIEILKIFAYRTKEQIDTAAFQGLDPARMEMETQYLVGLALFQIDGPGGPQWKSWTVRAAPWVLSLQERRRGRCDSGASGGRGTADRAKTTG